MIVVESGSATEPICNERDKSLDKALQRGTDAGAHTNKLVSRFGPSVVACAEPDYHT